MPLAMENLKWERDKDRKENCFAVHLLSSFNIESYQLL